MFESVEGLITPLTRQKAGSSLKGAAEPVAGVNVPGATDFASVIVVFASLRSASFSQFCAAAGLELKASEASSRKGRVRLSSLRLVATSVFIFVLLEKTIARFSVQ